MLVATKKKIGKGNLKVASFAKYYSKFNDTLKKRFKDHLEWKKKDNW